MGLFDRKPPEDADDEVVKDDEPVGEFEDSAGEEVPEEAVVEAPASTVEGYCVKERKKVAMKDPQQIQMKNGRPAVQGFCPDCGTKMFKIGKIVPH